MNAEDHLPIWTRWLRRKESLITVPLGGIPFSIGIKLREQLYRSILNSLGKSVQIKQDV